MADSGAERAARRIAEVNRARGHVLKSNNGQWNDIMSIHEMATIIREETGTQWISVSERLPETSQRVQLWRNGKWTVGYKDDSRHWIDELDTDNDGVPTSLTIASGQVSHFQPLPAAPDEGGTR